MIEIDHQHPKTGLGTFAALDFMLPRFKELRRLGKPVRGSLKAATASLASLRRRAESIFSWKIAEMPAGRFRMEPAWREHPRTLDWALRSAPLLLIFSARYLSPA
jgi:hypothetical protein